MADTQQPPTQTASVNGQPHPDVPERPEILVGAAFVGGLVLAQILKKLGSDD